MDIQGKIGKRIKEIREMKNLTQEELSQRSGLNRTFIIHVEKGRRNLSVVSLEKILKGLKTRFGEFFEKGKFK